jgi:hypothetical protein
MVSFKPRPLYHREKSPGTHWIGGWVGPTTVWTLWKRKNSSPYRDSNSDPSVTQPVASHYTDYAIPAPVESSTAFNTDCTNCTHPPYLCELQCIVIAVKSPQFSNLDHPSSSTLSPNMQLVSAGERGEGLESITLL